MPLCCLLLSVASDILNEERDSEDEWGKLSAAWVNFRFREKYTQY